MPRVARLLVATVPLTGHVHPMLVLVQALVQRDHDVCWYAGRKFEPAIVATGATYHPMVRALDFDDTDIERSLPVLRKKRGLSRVKAQLRAMFISPMVDQLHDLETLADQLAPDAIIADSAHLGAALLSEKRRLAWAGLGISGLVIPSIDTAPFGSALPPASDANGRIRNKLLNWVIFRVVFGAVNRSYRRARSAAGLAAGRGMYFDVMSPYLFLQPTIPELEYPRSDLPPQVHFIGPLVPREPPAAESLPPWWPELVAAKQRGVPIVLVTQGTLATDVRELVVPSLRGLASEKVVVVATLGRAVELADVPANAYVAPFVPYQALMPMLSAMVTNGGYGGVQMALRHQVPLVVAGGSEEKPEIAARTAWSGAGIDLRTGRPTPDAVRRAVRRVLDEELFRARARALGDKMARYDAPVIAATLIETLVAQRTPVLRASAYLPAALPGAA